MRPNPSDRPALAEFLNTLRTSLNHLSADTLPTPPELPAKSPTSVQLEITVSRMQPDGNYQRLAASRSKPKRVLRDLKRPLPPAPEKVILRTGDVVRIEVAATLPGYLTVLNVGPTGNLNLLWPDELPAPPTTTQQDANVPLHVGDVQVTDPAGRERLLAIWTRVPPPVNSNELLSLTRQAAGPVQATSKPYRATRDMARIKEAVQQLAPNDWHAAVLEIDHS